MWINLKYHQLNQPNSNHNDLLWQRDITVSTRFSRWALKNDLLRSLWTKSKDNGRRISRRFSIAADFQNIKAANSISQKQQRLSKNNPNLENDPIKRQGSWKRTKASAGNGRKDDYRHAISHFGRIYRR